MPAPDTRTWSGDAAVATGADWPPPLTMGDLVSAAVEGHPERTALIFPDERVQLRRIGDLIAQRARSLLALGVRRGGCVATLMPNCLDHVVAILAITSIGALCVPVNTRFRARELSHVVADSGATVLLTTTRGAEFADLPGRLSQALPELANPADQPASLASPLRLAAAPSLRHVILVGDGSRLGMVSDQDAMGAAQSVLRRDMRAEASMVTPEDEAIMLYTSGTTAMPKGCALLHRQMTSAGLPRSVTT